MSFGQAPLAEFQATYGSLQSMLENQFGTSTTTISKDDGARAGKSPEALKMQASRENARDTWDRFMGEKATQELFEGMLNLMTVKMEKPVNLAVFEDDIKALGYQAPAEDANGEKKEGKKVEGLDVFEGGKAGKMTINKSDVKSEVGYQYLIDANSTMKQDEEEQFQALMATWNLMHETPGLIQGLAQKGEEYDEGEHLKKIFIAAGISDWEKILKENPALIQQLKAQQAGKPGPDGQPQPGMDPNSPCKRSPAAKSLAQPMPQPGMPPQGPCLKQPMQPQMPQQPMQQQPGPPMGPMMQQGKVAY
jgi:hypothetical protein